MHLANGLLIVACLSAPILTFAKPRLPPPSDDVEQAERDLVKVCTRRNAERLWALFSERFRDQWDTEAGRYRTALTPKDLRTAYRYKGDPKKFDGKALLIGSLRRGVGDNPCDDAKNWTIVTHALARSHHVFAMRRSDGFSFGLKFQSIDGHWYLDEVTKVTPPQPAETPPTELIPAPEDSTP